MSTRARAFGAESREAIGLAGRFGIVLPRSQQVILFGKRRLWEKKADAEFHLQHSRGYADPSSELHSAYVGELGKDFWPDE